MNNPTIDRLIRALGNAAVNLELCGEHKTAEKTARVALRACGPEQQDVVNVLTPIVYPHLHGWAA